MALPISFLTLTVSDNTLKDSGIPEKGTITVPVITLTAANLVAQQALHTALLNAFDAIIIGNRAQQETVLSREVVTVTPASDPLAQRENKWLMRYHGATLGQKFQASLPTADLSLHKPNSEFLDLSTGVGATLKSAFEAVVRSPNDAAEAVVLDSAQFVGRNT